MEIHPQEVLTFWILKNKAQFDSLFMHLIQFFGQALGCSDGSIPPYTGRPSLASVHQSLNIPLNVFNSFNDIVVNACRKYGVAPSDLVSIRAVLQSTQTSIVASSAPAPGTTPYGGNSTSICDRYSAALKLTNKQLVFYVVNATLYNLVGNPVTGRYFNGEFPRYSTNFLQDVNALNRLYDGLIRFFGRDLKCSDKTIYPPRANLNLLDVHRNMGLDQDTFVTFNRLLISVLRDAGVTDVDLNTVSGLLNSYKSQIVSNLPIQDDYTGYRLQPNIIATIVILVIIFALFVALAVVGLTMAEKRLHFK